MGDLEIMEMFLLEPRGGRGGGKCELERAPLTRTERCSSQVHAGRWVFEEDLRCFPEAGREIKASRGNEQDRFRNPPGELRLLLPPFILSDKSNAAAVTFI